MKFSSNTYFENNIEVVELKNNITQFSAKIAVHIGNTLFSILQNKDEFLYFPYTLNEYANNKNLAGNPFMYPWANRLENDCITIENKKHFFTKNVENILFRDANNLPLHGLLLKTNQWQTQQIFSTENYICHHAILHFNDSLWLQMYPFLHTIEMKTYLYENTISIETIITNNDKKAMPISFGFHPYFAIKNSNISINIPLKNCIETDAKMIPTQNIFSIEKTFPTIKNNQLQIQNLSIDNGFCNFEKDNKKIIIQQQQKTIEIEFKDYNFAQIYYPNNSAKPYLCIEPMTAKTNAINTNDCDFLLPNQQLQKQFEIRVH